MKKLIVKIASDVTFATDAQIEAIKEVWRVSVAPSGLDVSFEVVAENEADTVRRLLNLVRSEFKEHDEAGDERH